MKSCLVVDDSRVIRRITARIMTGLGFTTEEAEDGVTALEACRTRMPDMILLDWSMPNMTGPEFLRALRHEQHGAHPVVVFCPTESDAAEIAEAFSAGANEYIMKPFDRGIIQAKLAEIGFA
jgi:two-component system chemotaxis response regulator CheY